MAELKPGILVRLSLSGAQILVCIALLAVWVLAQAPVSSPSAGPSSLVDRGIDLAAKGRCEEALPLLKELAASESDKEIKYRAQMATARCALKRKDGQATARRSSAAPR